MPLKDLLILTTPPQRLARVRALGITPAHLCYRIGRGGHLLRANSASAPRGGLIVVNAYGFDGQSTTGMLCQEILQECAVRGFTGILCRFPPELSSSLSPLVRQLDDQAARRGLTLYIPEWYASHATNAYVLISSALSGGSLTERLEESAGQVGSSARLALDIEPIAEQFLLPSPTGSGRTLSQEELRACMEDRAPTVYFSCDLCARYFTYMSGGRAYFVLFDDAGSIGKKLQIARSLGIPRAVGSLEALDPMLEELIAMPL